MKRIFYVLVCLIIVLSVSFGLVACGSSDEIKKPSGPPKDVESLVESMLYYKNFTYNDPLNHYDYYVQPNAIMMKSKYFKDNSIVYTIENDTYYKYIKTLGGDDKPILGVKEITKADFEEVMDKCCENLIAIRYDIKNNKYDISDPKYISEHNENGYTYKYKFDSDKLIFESYDNFGTQQVKEDRYFNFKETRFNIPSQLGAYKNNIASEYIEYTVENENILWLNIKNNGESISFDTNPFNIEGWDQNLIFKDIKGFFDHIGVSNTVIHQMEQTTGFDGLMTATSGKYYIQWRFHPSRGLEGVISE